MLAKILQLCRLNDELVDLVDDIKLLILLEVATVQLLDNAVQDLDGSGILRLRVLGAIGAFGLGGAAICPGSGAGDQRADAIGVSHELGRCNIGLQDGRPTGPATAIDADKSSLSVGTEVWPSRRGRVR